MRDYKQKVYREIRLGTTMRVEHARYRESIQMRVEHMRDYKQKVHR